MRFAPMICIQRCEESRRDLETRLLFTLFNALVFIPAGLGHAGACTLFLV